MKQLALMFFLRITTYRLYWWKKPIRRKRP